MVYGIDEAGRGSFAGPLVVAGVLLTEQATEAFRASTLPIRDSKTLTEKQREEVFAFLTKQAVPFTTAVISIEDINCHGVGWANYEGIKKTALALTTLVKDPKKTQQIDIIVDGRFPMDRIEVPSLKIRCQVDADATILPVILAGIVAKVTRDRIMKELDKIFPEYQWSKNKGYGTLHHRRVLFEHGYSVYHRLSFLHFACKPRQ